MSNFTSFHRWLILFAAFVFLIGGCSPEPEKKPLPPRLPIAVAVADLEWDGMQVLRKTVEERSRGERLDITWLDAKNDPAEQQRQIEHLLRKTGRQKVKAVVLQPVDPAQSSLLVEALARENIKVIVLEKLVGNAPLDGYIASDHVLAGQLQVRYVLNRAGRQKPLNALILKGGPADPAAQEIAAAIRHSLTENMRVLKELEHPRNDREAAERNVRQAIFENRIDVVLATDSRLKICRLERAGFDSGCRS